MSTLAEDLALLQKKKAASTKAKRAWEKKHAEAAKWEQHCYDRMESENTDSQKVGGVNFVKYEQTFGQIQDLSEFTKWALENEPELVAYKERGELINQKARQILDDDSEWPPGLSYRVNEKVGVRGAGKKKS